jgi:hypothetical protein
MIAALLWLTVSTPFVYSAQQIQKKQIKTEQKQYADNNPFSNTTEEKNESGVNTLSEYLHDGHLMEQGFCIVTKYYKCYPSDLYIEYHPELLSPPPEA